MHRGCFGWVWAALLVCAGNAHGQGENAWKYLENEHLRLGVNLESGAAIGWFSSKAQPQQNVINAYDRGRYVQQSYYGDEDGSRWNGTPWRYNPVQGGDWRGTGALLVEFSVEPGAKMYAKIIPRHWASGQLLGEAVMEEWIALEGKLAHVKCRLTWKGDRSHKPHHQELPACFVAPRFEALVYCEGEAWKGAPLTRRQPGDRNEYVHLGEPWVAWEDKDGFAVGVCSPTAEQATCYRVGGAAACSYVAPIETIALKPGLVIEREYWMGLGSVETLRGLFAALPRH